MQLTTPTPNHVHAWTVGLIYGPILPILLVLLGVDYVHISESIETVKMGVLLPMVLLGTCLATFITWQGWWKALLWEKRTLPVWTLLMPILMILTIYSFFNCENASARGIGFLMWTALATLGVGFCEEIVYRGITVVGFRSHYAEWQVWLFSSLLFGLIHVWNSLAGQSLNDSMNQFTTAFLFGSFLYAIRRAVGTILVTMLIHAAWDWSLFVSAIPSTSSAPSSQSPIAGYLIYAMMALFVISAKWMFSKPASMKN